MQKLEITKDNAISAYNKADDKGKELLATLLGKDVFPKKFEKYTDIETPEHAFEYLGLDIKKELPYPDAPNEEEQVDNAFKMLRIITKALNKLYDPTWKAVYNKNSSQKKWQPWFDGDAGAFRFGGSCYFYSDACSLGGARLSHAEREVSDYAGTKFLALYNIINTQP